MLALDSTQLLDAVKRSLLAHVLPSLKDEFARIQVAAAVRLLDEVNDRLQNGDPILLMNDAIAREADSIGAEARATEPVFADAVARAIQVEQGLPPREHNRALMSALWPLCRDARSPHSQRLQRRLIELSNDFAQQDAGWLCTESLLSLV